MSSIFDRFELASFKRMFNNAKMVSEYSKKNIVFVLTDMAKSILFDKVGYMEYNLFHFVNKSKELKETYVDFEYSQNLFKTLNDKEHIKLFNDKLQFNKIFKDVMKRGFLDVANSSYEDFELFCKDKEAIFCKPNDSCSGIGIYKKIDLVNKDLNEIYDFLKTNNLYVEDLIIQHDKMSKLHPESINTVRVTTLLKDNEVHVMYTILRIGTDHKMVDNVGSGGIYTVLDNKGEIIAPCWSDKTLKTYYKHPTTNEILIGFEIPYFNEAIELCKTAAKVMPEIRYVGWDIAITNIGPVIVEGNPLPGYDMAQNYFASGKDYGLKPEFEKILNS